MPGLQSQTPHCIRWQAGTVLKPRLTKTKRSISSPQLAETTGQTGTHSEVRQGLQGNNAKCKESTGWGHLTMLGVLGTLQRGGEALRLVATAEVCEPGEDGRWWQAKSGMC